MLKGLDLCLAPGEFVAIVGRSGCGKTTLLNLLGLLDRPCSGYYWLDGHETSHLNNRERALLRQRKIAFIFQAFHLLPQLSALDNVALPLVYRGYGWRAARMQAGAMMQGLGLSSKINSPPKSLSGGQQQRVGVARALVSSPALLLADEPTGNLDGALALAAYELLNEVRRHSSAAIVLVTHDEAMAKRCDRLYRLQEGSWVSNYSDGTSP
ncbi:ABC transporter ATP-binding protein [Burkholderia diffusa]|uniref:ABC transporter ATP-binding protein n=1 Tax=Burkholderia diffusa TaxID=488732 RepID=UPI001E318517|nr:ABC transporter ATP-binding protein [Burkholderia diffusa]